MLKLGILGVGNITTDHIAAYNQLNSEGTEIEIAAYCDTSPEKLRGKENARTYTDVDRFLKEEDGKLDFIDICVPTFLHKSIVLKVLNAGFNVLCEKPMALTKADADEMSAAAKKSGKTLMIAHCVRFGDVTQVLRKYCESGELGKPMSAEFNRQDGTEDANTAWFTKKELSGGAVLDLHIHDVDTMNYLFGMPDYVSTAALSTLPDGGFNSMSINYMYENGFYVNAKADWTLFHNKFNKRSCRVNFEKGYIYYNDQMKVFVKVDHDGNEEDLTSYLKNDSYYNEIKYFTHCILNNKPVEMCTPESSAEAVKIALAASQSAERNGERISIK